MLRKTRRCPPRIQSHELAIFHYTRLSSSWFAVHALWNHVEDPDRQIRRP